jgi:hypothetical protein
MSGKEEAEGGKSRTTMVAVPRKKQDRQIGQEDVRMASEQHETTSPCTATAGLDQGLNKSHFSTAPSQISPV